MQFAASSNNIMPLGICEPHNAFFQNWSLKMQQISHEIQKHILFATSIKKIARTTSNDLALASLLLTLNRY